MTREYSFYLDDMIKALTLILQFTDGLSFQDLERNDLVSSAVIRQFEILGEAAKHIPPDIRERHSKLPWNEMSRTRDKLIHAYFGLDLEILWKVIREQAPGLLEELRAIRKQTRDD